MLLLFVAQWQKSPGVFMKREREKFTIEDGTLRYTLIKI